MLIKKALTHTRAVIPKKEKSLKKEKKKEFSVDIFKQPLKTGYYF